MCDFLEQMSGGEVYLKIALCHPMWCCGATFRKACWSVVRMVSWKIIYVQIHLVINRHTGIYVMAVPHP